MAHDHDNKDTILFPSSTHPQTMSTTTTPIDTPAHQQTLVSGDTPYPTDIDTLHQLLRERDNTIHQLRNDIQTLTSRLQNLETNHPNTSNNDTKILGPLPITSKPLTHLTKNRASRSGTSICHTSFTHGSNDDDDVVLKSDTGNDMKLDQQDVIRKRVLGMTGGGNAIPVMGISMFNPASVKLRSVSNASLTDVSGSVSGNMKSGTGDGGNIGHGGLSNLGRTSSFGSTSSISTPTENEIRTWIKQKLCNDDMDVLNNPTLSLHEALRDGKILCRLINKISKIQPIRINTQKFMVSHIENIQNFITACEHVGVSRKLIFRVHDLSDGSDMDSVMKTIWALKRVIEG